jgi:hypothetical protein
MTRIRSRFDTRRRKQAALAVGLAVAATVLGPAAAALADSGTNKPGAAVVTPTLKILAFGDNVGLPTGCQLASSLVGTTADQAGLTKAVSPLILAVNAQCSTLQAQGASMIATGESNSTGLDGINPVANPVIAATADSFQTVGDDYGSGLAPFGPTISGMSGFIAFFEGS